MPEHGERDSEFRLERRLHGSGLPGRETEKREVLPSSFAPALRGVQDQRRHGPAGIF